MRVVLIIGPPGSGKTSVLEALMGLLEAEDTRYAALELEALALVHPWPDNDAAFDHLRFVAASYGERGYPTLLVTATVEDADYFARLRGALQPHETFCARLEAPSDVLRTRIEHREPPDWVGLPGLLDRVAPLAQAMEALADVDRVFSTDGTDARQVAAAVWEHGAS